MLSDLSFESRNAPFSYMGGLVMEVLITMGCKEVDRLGMSGPL